MKLNKFTVSKKCFGSNVNEKFTCADRDHVTWIKSSHILRTNSRTYALAAVFQGQESTLKLSQKPDHLPLLTCVIIVAVFPPLIAPSGGRDYVVIVAILIFAQMHMV